MSSTVGKHLEKSLQGSAQGGGYVVVLLLPFLVLSCHIRFYSVLAGPKNARIVAMGVVAETIAPVEWNAPAPTVLVDKNLWLGYVNRKTK